MANNQNSNRGFGSMSEDKQRDIASKGGKASHEKQGGQGSESSGRDSGSSGQGGDR